MDSTRRNRDGVAPAMPIIRRLEAAKTVKQLFDIQLELAAYGDAEFIRYYMSADEKEASKNILSVVQGGIILGQKEY